jgi:hypothetical protein
MKAWSIILGQFTAFMSYVEKLNYTDTPDSLKPFLLQEVMMTVQ